jgi:hypothetical protein
VHGKLNNCLLIDILLQRIAAKSASSASPETLDEEQPASTLTYPPQSLDHCLRTLFASNLSAATQTPRLAALLYLVVHALSKPHALSSSSSSSSGAGGSSSGSLSSPSLTALQHDFCRVFDLSSTLLHAVGVLVHADQRRRVPLPSLAAAGEMLGMWPAVAGHLALLGHHEDALFLVNQMSPVSRPAALVTNVSCFALLEAGQSLQALVLLRKGRAMVRNNVFNIFYVVCLLACLRVSRSYLFSSRCCYCCYCCYCC